MEAVDSLPYIDEVSEEERVKAKAVIQRETVRTNKVHPSLATSYTTSFPALFAKELDRLKTGESRQGGIDLSRYEASDEPDDSADVQAWKAAVQTAYTNYEYLQGREGNISLLEESGKNAWLIGNFGLENILKQMEREYSQIKDESENVNRARKSAQEGSKAELIGLQEAWKTGIGKIIETQVATQNLRRDLHQARVANMNTS